MASTKYYIAGNKIRVSVTFKQAGVSVDPGAIFVSYQRDSQAAVVWQYGVDDEVVKDSTGHYHADIDAATAGAWKYRWYSTGAGQAADQGAFTVTAAAPAP